MLRQQKPCCRHLTSVGRKENPGKKPLAGRTGDEGIRRPGSDSAGSQGEGLDLDHMGLKEEAQAVRGPPCSQGVEGRHLLTPAASLGEGQG